MNKVNFFDGMQPTSADFNDVELYFEERINKNQAALTDKGVLVNADLPNGITLNAPYLSADNDNKSLSVYGFLAYDNSGHILYLEPSFLNGVKVPSLQNLKPIDDSTSTLSNRQLVNTGNSINFGNNIEYYVVARYNEVYTNDLAPQEDTNVLIPSRVKTSVSFYLREYNSIVEGDVILGVVTSDEFGVLSVDESKRDVLTVRGDLITAELTHDNQTDIISFADHINMRGTGIYSPSNPHALSAKELGIDPTATGNHQLYEHSNGIQSDTPQTVSSALAYQFTSNSDATGYIVSVQPLFAGSNEIAAISNTILYPGDFSGPLSASLDQTTDQGYYIISLNTSATLELAGPFESEQDSGFINTLNNRGVLPICSFYWGVPRAYSILLSGTLSDNTQITDWGVSSIEELITYEGTTIPASEVTVGTVVYYSPASLFLTITSKVIPSGEFFITNKEVDLTTLVDRRQFNNTSVRDINTSDLASIRDGAPFSTETSRCFNARIVSSKNTSIFSLSNKNLQIEFDGVLCSSYLTFPAKSYYTISTVIKTINDWIQSSYQGPHTEDGYLPTATVNHEGKLSITAADSIVVIDLGEDQADSELGITAGTENGTDISGYLKAIVTSGEISSTQEFYYDENNRLTNIYYSLPGGITKSGTIHYSLNGNIVGYDGII